MNALSQKTLRSLIANKRKELTPEEVIKKSHQAISLFLSLFSWKKIEPKEFYVGFYRPFPFELDLSELELEFKKRGCRLAYPRVGTKNDADRNMEFFEVPELNSPRHWSLGRYGVQEPDPSLPLIRPELLSLIFVPGVAFGKNGSRIGRGAGYYDRYLVRATQALRVALCFDLQYVESDIEAQSWDQNIHWLLTDSRELRFAGLMEDRFLR